MLGTFPACAVCQASGTCLHAWPCWPSCCGSTSPPCLLCMQCVLGQGDHMMHVACMVQLPFALSQQPRCEALSFQCGVGKREPSLFAVPDRKGSACLAAARARTPVYLPVKFVMMLASKPLLVSQRRIATPFRQAARPAPRPACLAAQREGQTGKSMRSSGLGKHAYVCTTTICKSQQMPAFAWAPDSCA